MNGFPISDHQRFKTSTFSYVFQLWTLHEVAIPKGRCCDRLWDELSFLLFTWWNPHVPVTWSCWKFGSKLSIDSQKFVACPHLKNLAMSQLDTNCCKDSVANVSSVGLIQGMIEYIPWHQWERNPSVLLSYCLDWPLIQLKGMAVESCNVCWRLAILSRWKVNGEESLKKFSGIHWILWTYKKSGNVDKNHLPFSQFHLQDVFHQQYHQ